MIDYLTGKGGSPGDGRFLWRASNVMNIISRAAIIAAIIMFIVQRERFVGEL